MSKHHGHAAPGFRTPTYITWMAMIQRCTNPKHKSYHRYGGRGVQICERWRNSFEAFKEDMGERSSEQSIERIDNNGNYEPGNCRWATNQEQNLNREDTVKITIGSVTKTIPEWAEVKGLSPNALYLRIRNGWDPVTAIITPPRKQLDDKEVLELVRMSKETDKTQDELAGIFDISMATVQAILSGRNRSSVTGIKHAKIENRKQNVYLESTPELLTKIREWRRAKVSRRDMAKNLGVSRTVITRLCLEEQKQLLEDNE